MLQCYNCNLITCCNHLFNLMYSIL